MNIYITPANEQWLREWLAAGQTMSGIINRLIEQQRAVEKNDDAIAKAMLGDEEQKR